MTWAFTASQAETVNLWSEEDTRDAEKSLFFYPMMYQGAGKAKNFPESGKFRGMIRVVTKFNSAPAGNRVTIPHIPRTVGQGVEGNTMLQGTGGVQSIQSQDLFYNNFAHALISDGRLSDARAVLKFIDVCRPSLRDWYRKKVEEAFILQLCGLTAPNNPTILENWAANTTATWLNAINAFDASHIMYAGDATSNGTIDSADVLTAQVLTKLSTAIREDLSIPIEPMMVGGQEAYALLVSGRGKEQLLYDEQFREAHTIVVPEADNPLTQRATMKFDKFYIIEYPKLLNPAANVGQAIVCGADALMYAKVKEAQYYQNDADWAERRTAVSISADAGVKTNYHDSARYNSYALRHYVRS